MNNPFGEVPVLPVVVPLGLVFFAWLLWRLHERRLFSVPRALVAAALAVYAGGIVANTVFPIFLHAPSNGEPWSPAVAVIPFFDYEVGDAAMNLLVFVPLGMLMPLILVRPTFARILLISAAISLAIELAQLAAQGLFEGGHIADINDLFFNAVGGVLGYGLFMLLSRIPRLSRLIDLFRWTEPGVAPSFAVKRRSPSRG